MTISTLNRLQTIDGELCGLMKKTADRYRRAEIGNIRIGIQEAINSIFEGEPDAETFAKETIDALQGRIKVVIGTQTAGEHEKFRK